MNKDFYDNNELQIMDLDTLKLILITLDNKLNLLKDKKPKSKSIEGMELACQIVLGLIADKERCR